ncbi:amino acid adenylation domain-containing protein [Plantactinospora sp. KLBMP9567]|uniref:amino acid adenylation domain-containing protein n=1 Tax=Plantactinospora sp. KLBMP9567 TaxID=3085900 RepID=UPI002982220C|nr:amino acid adenylation domain-containing protein [Plantactinospora sp. KLBMP9567]MDW5330131.1 amino acid adenylation domain-containing protein [Plantactinospora sp. KLBMP9567]
MTSRRPDLTGSRRPDLTGPALTYPAHVLDLLEPRLAGAGPAVVDRDGGLDYPELREWSDAVAAALRDRGVRRDEPVLVHTRLSRWAVVGMLGVLRAGARYVAVDAAFPVRRQHQLAESSGARVVLAQPGLPPLPDRHDTLVLDALPTPSTTRAARRGTLAYTCFTSGSTGRPKGVTISAAALAYSTAARLGYYPEPVTAYLLCSSISFDSSVAGIYWTLACGGTLVVPSDRPTDLVAVGEAASRYAASHLLMVPSLYGVALRGGLARQLGSLRTVIVAGESCPPELVGRHLAALPQARLYNEYGPTECTVWSTVHACRPADAEGRSVPIGGPIPGTRVYVCGEDGGPVPAGEIGELCIGGPGLAVSREPADGPTDHTGDGDPDGNRVGQPGDGDPDGRAESGDREAFGVLGGERVYRTGDLVSVRADGALDFHGRADFQLKLGGVRVERAEIAHALGTADGVTAAGVGVVSDPEPGGRGGRHRLVGFVVPAADPLDRRRLREHLLALLPAAALPARIELVAALPRLPNGKIDNTELDRRGRALLAG